MTNKRSMPYAPLEALAITALRQTRPDDEPNDYAIAVFLGVSHGAVNRWRTTGRIPWMSADVAAVALGLHPMSIWPEEWMELDRGLLNGTDQRSIAAVERAIEQVGRVLEAKRQVV
jgi:hypothetical protein